MNEVRFYSACGAVFATLLICECLIWFFVTRYQDDLSGYSTKPEQQVDHYIVLPEMKVTP